MKKYMLLSLMLLTSAINIVAMEVRRSCEICFEEKAGNEFKPLSCCGYNVSCTDCLVDVINTSLQEKTIANIVCPNRNCAQPIELQDIYAITQSHPEVYATYFDTTAREYVINEKHIKHCPTPDCTYSFINENGLKQEFNCPQCNHMYCSNCLVQHAQEMTCEQAKRERELTENPDLANQATQKWIAANTKECPSCHKSIQKNGGCNHMTCNQCKHEFCWTCGATYRTTRCNFNSCETNNQQLPIGQIGQGQAGGNPFLLAAQHGHLNMVEILLEHGALNINQQTALQLAIQHNNPAVAHALLNAGANLHAPIQNIQQIAVAGNHIVTGNANGIARIWDLEGNMIRDIQPNNNVQQITVAGNRIVTRGVNGVTRIWDLRTGRSIIGDDDQLV